MAPCHNVMTSEGKKNGAESDSKGSKWQEERHQVGGCRAWGGTRRSSQKSRIDDRNVRSISAAEIGNLVTIETVRRRKGSTSRFKIGSIKGREAGKEKNMYIQSESGRLHEGRAS
eukprot:1159220-Pelagomonas_calceolata.AAC.1